MVASVNVNFISFEDAKSNAFDVIVVGTSFASMFFVHGLQRNASILFIEKGSIHSHDEWIGTKLNVGESFDQENTSGLEKHWVANTIFGGNSNCWWGQVPRFHPSDFRLKSLYGIGEDWPIDYDTLEPFYAEVEDIMEVAGGGSEHLLPRSGPFPYPPHIPSRTDVRLRAERPDIWFAAPTARSNGGSRALCCANGICSVCPIDAKFTVVNGVGRFRPKTVHLLTDVEARALRLENGTARSILVKERSGAEAEIAADLFALGANAIFNPAILMRSGYEHAALGRYLHEQNSLSVTLDIVQDNYFGGTSVTGHCYGLYDGSHRKDGAAILVENFNTGGALRSDPGRWTQRMMLKLIAEDIPLADNRVVLGSDGEPRLFWGGHAPYSLAGLYRARDNLQTIMPFEIEGIVGEDLATGEAHIQGTHRMGDDPARSVVDRTLRVHGLANVLALGAGSFPSCSAANPTLTLSALSIMAGRSL